MILSVSPPLSLCIFHLLGEDNCHPYSRLGIHYKESICNWGRFFVPGKESVPMTLFEFIEEIVNRLRDSEKNHYGYFYKTGGLSIETPQEAIRFDKSDCVSPEISHHNGSIQLQTPGIYRADYIVNLPSHLQIDTVFSLSLDGKILPGSPTSVHKSGDDSLSLTGQAIFPSCLPCVLQLCSQSPFQFEDQEESVSISLSVLRISGLPPSGLS